MKKPRKVEKPAKVRMRVPADQIPLKTMCELCDKMFPNPTEAAWHIAVDHKE